MRGENKTNCNLVKLMPFIFKINTIFKTFIKISSIEIILAEQQNICNRL